ncbi:MAG: 3-hydroxyacyl-ACP dehydratase [Verrucomicrobia bacterium CG_4_10_14_3_um_filter_43_23]|nr:MAG: hypothetical protein AUJ82_02025 [Verrucomicrobia bacterium CG1_02_43_26]PIP59671.1 MAG: 3-hydroxyacyl-ACP dehydratase [Verrucomicrobia bacterium CG22_combo_CG10-13_8_21_14_all_43_17]PIX58994.1 MAG: 3-hydroxyacyl-ACP dehydratase [Verrucomicrobia bacterium CG_4_10_14_3_um_filter_43_23]PIY63115.1 MAG: 3-hydroxyacyl-ACP dehydratase [Verrucomicrobia bacterium CG_4_10_14_0_8_um_filter_43_34]PJA43623.1 MAG: 3-hydroxyacyl-ACP dehydratase [Verrucomicrobia bacterium CG_4_9_14_3_um_filter_43_20]
MEMDRARIRSILPHQEPFLFLDSATLEEKTASGLYQVTGSEDFLKGHFKEEPIFPASIMMEALGQLAVLFLLTTKQPELTMPVDNKRVMFTSSDRLSCHNVCRPGDLLEMRIQLKRVRPPLMRFDGYIRKDGEKVLSVEGLTLAFDFLK